jgi:hypothetical protein
MQSKGHIPIKFKQKRQAVGNFSTN